MKLMKVRKRIVYTSVVFALLFAFVFPVSAAEKDSGVPSLSYIEEVFEDGSYFSGDDHGDKLRCSEKSDKYKNGKQSI